MEPKTQSKALSWLRGMLACRGEWLADVVTGLAIMCERHRADGDVFTNDVTDAVSAYLSPLPDDAEVGAALDALSEAGLVRRFSDPGRAHDYLIGARERAAVSRFGARQWLVMCLVEDGPSC